jgi:hypothetical protein
MIIYGYRNKPVRIAGGMFECPICKTQRAYNHINTVRMFTLFFIPLFPLGRVNTYIECEFCKHPFIPEKLLDMPGNEQFGHELEARNVLMEIQNRQKRGIVTAVLGMILGVAGALALLVLIIFQLTNGSDPTEGLVGLACMMGICPLPLLVVGGGLLAWGVRIRMKAAKDMNTPVVELTK